MQAFPDILLGWTSSDGGSTSYYVRQLRDMKGSVDLTAMSPVNLVDYGRACGWTLARSHARAGHPATIAGYLGKSDPFDRALAAFAAVYADQNELTSPRSSRRSATVDSRALTASLDRRPGVP
jgi:sugar/nucleoside kinase (ribokinase family)